LAAAVGLSLVADGLDRAGLATDAGASWVFTLYLTGFFVAGAILATRWQPIVASLRSMSPRWTTALALAGLFLYSWHWVVGWLITDRSRDPLADWLTAAGAALILTLAASGRLAPGLFRHPWLVGLGRISYSLYLVHIVVLLVLVHTLAALPMPLVLG